MVFLPWARKFSAATKHWSSYSTSVFLFVCRFVFIILIIFSSVNIQYINIVNEYFLYTNKRITGAQQSILINMSIAIQLAKWYVHLHNYEVDVWLTHGLGLCVYMSATWWIYKFSIITDIKVGFFNKLHSYKNVWF